MGRGLEAILAVSSPGTAQEELREVPVELISSNPHQPRRRFDEEALSALAESLGERGVLQPVLVRPQPDGTYELIAGERRWSASRIAGLKTVPALVRSHDDAASLELALIENMAREDLNPVEEARACAALVEELGLTREEVGRRVGRGRVAVTNLMRLLDLPDEALELLEGGGLSEGHGRALLLARITAPAASWRAPRSRRGGRCEPRRIARGAATGRHGAIRARGAGLGRPAGCTPTRQLPRRRSRRRGARRWVPRCEHARGRMGATESSSRLSPPRRRWRWRVGWESA